MKNIYQMKYLFKNFLPGNPCNLPNSPLKGGKEDVININPCNHF